MNQARRLSIFRQPLGQINAGEFGFAVVSDTSKERFLHKKWTVEYGIPHIKNLLELLSLMELTFANSELARRLLAGQEKLEFINEAPEDYRCEYAPLERWLVFDTESLLTNAGLPISFEIYRTAQQGK